MLKLSDTKQYKKDIQKFTQGLNKIKKPMLQEEYQKTLKEFVHQCELIDNAHSSDYSRKIDPKSIRENVIELARLRKKLKDYLN